MKSKKEFVCSECETKHIVWEGICRNCGAIGTLEEKILIPEKPKANKSQRSILQRSKRGERSIGKRMLSADGEDPNFKRIASSTGRVGHITNMRIDTISRTYVTEQKNRVLPKWVISAWILIQQRSIDFGKHAHLHMDPPNMPKSFPINGENRKTESMSIITQSRHEELIAKERQLEEILEEEK